MIAKRRAAERRERIDRMKEDLIGTLEKDHGHSRDVVEGAALFLAVFNECEDREHFIETLKSNSGTESSARTASSTDSNEVVEVTAASNAEELVKGALVAYILPTKGKRVWTLGRIVNTIRSDRKYGVSEGFGRSLKHRVEPENIKLIPKHLPNCEPGTRVMAVYPGTDTFYPAQLVERGQRTWLLAFDNEGPNDTYVKEVTFGQIFLP